MEDKATSPDNVIPLPLPTTPQPRQKRILGTPYPATFSRVLAIHMKEQTRQAKNWVPTRERSWHSGILVGLIVLGLGFAAVAIIL